MNGSEPTPPATGITKERLAGLRSWNLGLAMVHLAQAALIVFLSTDFAITVTSSFPEGPPGTAAPAPEPLFDANIGWCVAAFLGLAALDHLLTATVYRTTYERDLKRGINRFRWVEYSLSATLMIILISFYSGITGINAVITIASANVGMILFGWLQELMNPPGRATTNMLPFWFGTIIGLGAWISIAVMSSGPQRSPGRCTGSSSSRQSSSSASGSTNGCSTARSAGGPTTPTERRPTWRSAWRRSPCSPGRSSPCRWRPERRPEPGRARRGSVGS